ncbi:hypothetical protein D3C87_1698470 [compost metagenome]
MLRFASSCKVNRRRGKGVALLAWSDRQSHHILFEPFVITDTCVAAAFYDVDEILIGHDFQPDFRIGL